MKDHEQAAIIAERPTGGPGDAQVQETGGLNQVGFNTPLQSSPNKGRQSPKARYGKTMDTDDQASTSKTPVFIGLQTSQRAAIRSRGLATPRPPRLSTCV